MRFQKEPKLQRKNISNFKKKPVACKSLNQYLVDKTADPKCFGCSRKERGPVITETALQFSKISLRSLMFKKMRKNTVRVLTAISCPLKARDTLASCLLKNYDYYAY